MLFMSPWPIPRREKFPLLVEKKTETQKKMGTREVYEEKLRSGNLHHDPTMKPGLGCPRCPRCLSLLDPNSVTSLSLSTFFPLFLIQYDFTNPLRFFFLKFDLI